MANPIHILFILLIVSVVGCRGQQPNSPSDPSPSTNEQTPVGGPFENRHFMFIGMPDQIASVDTSAGWHQNDQKLMIT